MSLWQVCSGRGCDAAREYRILSRGAHGGVVRALALFAEVPRAGAHTLVLELVGGGPLLDWAAGAPDLYTQRTVAAHTRQLLSALDHLHSNHVAHLDVRVSTTLYYCSYPTEPLKFSEASSLRYFIHCDY